MTKKKPTSTGVSPKRALKRGLTDVVPKPTKKNAAPIKKALIKKAALKKKASTKQVLKPRQLQNRPHGTKSVAIQPKTFSKYDDQAIKAIHAWKDPEIGWFGYATTKLTWPLSKAGDLLLSTPGIGDAIKYAVQGTVGVCNDLAHWSVSKESIYNEFRKTGHEVDDSSDIFDLELEQIDKVVGWLDAKYKSLAFVEGAGTGAVGLPGIPADIVALLTLNLRAIGEYATYYGFDLSLPTERLFAMNILALASSPDAACKQMAMAQLVKIAQDVARKQAWKQLEQYTYVQVMQQISKALGIRLTKDKLAQVIPVTGAAIGGGFNAYFTSNVCQAAYFLYRERFLAMKYGVKVIEETVKPAKDIDPHYPEEDVEIS